MITHNTALVWVTCASMLGAAACQSEQRGINRTNPASDPAATAPKSNLPTIEPSPSGAFTNTTPADRMDPLLTVANLGALQQPAGMVKLGLAPARLVVGTTVIVRSSPGGAQIATIVVKDGVNEAVNEVAQDASANNILVVYADPSDGSKNLGGWVSRDSIEGKERLSSAH